MKLRSSSPSLAFDLESEERIDDLDKLKSIDGYTYIDDEEDNCFGFWLIDENDDSIIKDSGISGGYLQFSFNDKLNRLEASVEYILSKGIEASCYTVLFPIKQGNNAETYRVKGKDGKLYFLKLFNSVKLHCSAFDTMT